MCTLDFVYGAKSSGGNKKLVIVHRAHYLFCFREPAIFMPGALHLSHL